MTIGFVIGESKPTMVRAQTARPLAVGEYVIIDSTEKKILGLVEKSSISSAAFADIQNYEEAFESKEIAENNIRDKSYISNIGILGFLDGLKKGTPVLPAIPPIPGTAILTATKEDLEEIFGPNEEVWIKIGKLLRNNTIDAKINLDKIVSRHLGILAMTGMGKSNLVALITKEIAKLKGTVIIFDYHNDYTFLDIPKINVIDAKINPRLLDADALSEVLEIRENANVQQRVLRVALTQTVKESKEFWNKLEREVDIIINSDDKKEKENRNSAYRVKDKIDDAQHRFADILDPDMGYPLSFIKEGRANVLNISELSEKQANVALAFYLQELLRDRKESSAAKNRRSKKQRDYKFEWPIFVIVEEAHVFIPKERDTTAKYWAAKIAREGRKFGMGLGIVSQRPRSVDLNVLSQMGSFAIMKIIQEDDQRQIASATESTSRELITQLTSLNVGDAILVGQWVNLPSLVHIEEVKEKKAGSDQSAVSQWASGKKMDGIAVESTQDLIQKDLLLE